MSGTIELIAILLALVFIVFLQIVFRVIKVRNAYDNYKKTTGLQMLPKPWSPGGHDPEIGFDPYIWLKLEPMHRRYGRTFGWMAATQPAIMTIDLDLIKEIVLADPNLHLDRPNLDLPYNELGKDSIAFSKAKQWSRIRRAMIPALAAHKIKSPEMAGEIEWIISRLIDSIDKKIITGGNGKSIELDFGDLMAHFTTEVVYSCFYGQRGQISFDGKRSHHIEESEIGMEGLSSYVVKIAKIYPSIAPFICFLGKHFHPSGKTRKTLINFIKLQTKLNLEARLQRSPEAKEKHRRSVIDAFIDSFHEGKLNYNEYLSSSFFFYFAASKTTSDALSLTVYYLARHEDIQEKLRNSILAEGVESEYLSWCINESMRLQPPSLIGSARALSCDIKYDNLKIPEGTIVLTPAYTIHRMREYWGLDANEFKPERFARANSFHPAQFIPFGLGKRSCPGKDFAIHEIKWTLVALLSRYKFEMSPRTNDTLLFKSPFFIMTIYEDPIYLKIRRYD